MSNLILLIILWSFLECAYKKIPIYEEFITGVKEGMHYLMILFPSWHRPSFAYESPANLCRKQQIIPSPP